jgi:hypothetical protein
MKEIKKLHSLIELINRSGLTKIQVFDVRNNLMVEIVEKKQVDEIHTILKNNLHLIDIEKKYQNLESDTRLFNQLRACQALFYEDKLELEYYLYVSITRDNWMHIKFESENCESVILEVVEWDDVRIEEYITDILTTVFIRDFNS